MLWYLFFILFATVQFFASASCPTPTNEEQLASVLSLTNDTAEAKLVSFNYVNEDLITILNKLAAASKSNLLLPSDAKKIAINVTLVREDPILLEEAWAIVNTILDIAGYTIVPRGSVQEIVPIVGANKEALPTYINVHPATLPSDNSRIRYLYAFQNISLRKTTARNNIKSILTDVLSGVPSTNNFIIDEKANSIVLTNKASNIKAAMSIITELDQEGFRETIEVVPLVYANANNVVSLIREMIGKPSQQNPYLYGPAPAPAQKTKYEFFGENTSVVSIERNNAVAIMGKAESVTRVKEFITKHLDIPTQAGKSIIHIRPIHYLDAKELAPILQKVVKARLDDVQGAYGQEGNKDGLSKVVIVAEEYGDIEEIQKLGGDDKKQKLGGKKKGEKKHSHGGSNAIIVAAREEEWKVIDRLIDEIDQPQPQVIIQGLIVDLALTDEALIGTQARVPNEQGKTRRYGIQGAHIQKPLLNYTADNADAINTKKGINADLLKSGGVKDDGTFDAAANIVKKIKQGATLFSAGFSQTGDTDGIGLLCQFFDGYDNAKIISQPFVTTLNHKQASFSLFDQRLVEGGVKNESVGGPVTIKKENIKADLTIDIIPRISNNDLINLEILTHANEFVSASTTNNTIRKREIKTNANVMNKDVLVIGGLTKLENTDIRTEFPKLANVPILGNLLKSRNQKAKKSTLLVFFSPTIIRPRKNSINAYTQDKLDFAKDKIKESCDLFDKLDPITRILFTNQTEHELAMVEGIEHQDMFQDDEPIETNKAKQDKNHILASVER